MSKNILTQELLREYFYYNAEFGRLVRKKMPGQPDQNSAYCQQFIGSPLGEENNNKGYLRVVIFRKKYAYHRVIFLYHHGYVPNCVDHINRVKSDNRIENLRDATPSLNSHNSGADGYSMCRNGKFRARITVEGEQVELGTYDTEAEASAAYKAVSLYVWGVDSPFHKGQGRGESKLWGAKRHK